MRHQDICLPIAEGCAHETQPEHRQLLKQHAHLAAKNCPLASSCLSDGFPSAHACTGLISSISQAKRDAWQQHIQDQHSEQLPGILKLASEWAALQAASSTGHALNISNDQFLLAQSRPQQTYSCPLGCKHVPETLVPSILRQGLQYVLEQHILQTHVQELQFAIQLTEHLSETSNHDDKCLVPGCSFSASQHAEAQQQGSGLVHKYNLKVVDKEDWQLLHRKHHPLRDASFQSACKTSWKAHYLSSAEHCHTTLMCAQQEVQYAKRRFATNNHSQCKPWLVRCSHTGCTVHVNSILAFLQHEAHFHHKEIARQNWTQLTSDNHPNDAQLLACPVPECTYACTKGSGIARHITSEHAALAQHVSHAVAVLAASKKLANGDKPVTKDSQHAVVKEGSNVHNSSGNFGLAVELPVVASTKDKHDDTNGSQPQPQPQPQQKQEQQHQHQLGTVHQSATLSQTVSSTTSVTQANKTDMRATTPTAPVPSTPLRCPLFFDSCLQLGEVAGQLGFAAISTANCNSPQLALHQALHSTLSDLSDHFITDHAEVAAACIAFATGQLDSQSGSNKCLLCNRCINTAPEALENCDKVPAAPQVEAILRHTLDFHMSDMIAIYHMVCLLAAAAGSGPERGKLRCPFGCVSSESCGPAPQVSPLFIDSRYNGELPPSSMVTAAFGCPTKQPISQYSFADTTAVMLHIMSCHAVEAVKLTRHAKEAATDVVTHV